MPVTRRTTENALTAWIVLPELGPEGCSSADTELGCMAGSCEHALAPWRGLTLGLCGVRWPQADSETGNFIQAGLLFGGREASGGSRNC